jgi:N-methylhydantoinase B
MRRRRLSEVASITYEGDRQFLVCEHCEERFESPLDTNPLDVLKVYEGPVTDAGPTMWPQPADFVDAPVVFRQLYCPACYTAMLTMVVPKGHRLPEDGLH